MPAFTDALLFASFVALGASASVCLFAWIVGAPKEQIGATVIPTGVLAFIGAWMAAGSYL